MIRISFFVLFLLFAYGLTVIEDKTEAQQRDAVVFVQDTEPATDLSIGTQWLHSDGTLKVASAINPTTWITVGGGGGGGLGYALTVGASSFNPTDAITNYIGQHYNTPAASALARKTFILVAGTITAASINTFSGTAGTAEGWSVYVRLNNTTDTLIQTVSTSASERTFSNSSLNIPVVAGDYFEIKTVNPTWVTNPVTTTIGGYVYIQ